MTLSIKEINKSGFDITIELQAQDFLTDFNNKWKRDHSGLIVGSDGTNWDTDYYTIGTLKHGADVTTYMAQKEFNRDCEAFDISLIITVFKNGVELATEYVINADYNYNDEETPDQVLERLYLDYGNNSEDQIKEAQEKKHKKS